MSFSEFAVSQTVVSAVVSEGGELIINHCSSLLIYNPQRNSLCVSTSDADDFLNPSCHAAVDADPPLIYERNAPAARRI